MKHRFASVDELRAAIGQPLGPSNWLEISQTRIHLFAEASGDHQWIHTDPERARRDSPYGQTIAHGYLTIGLTPMMMSEIFELRGAHTIINYGLNRVRFPAPVLEGSKVRMHAALTEVLDIERGIQVLFDIHYENDRQSKPVCVAQAVSRLYL